MFRNAIARRPGNTFSQGLTTVDLGLPDLSTALNQHQAYCEVLASCGLKVEVLPEELDYPDSTFVEDTAVLVPRQVILTRPGAFKRRGEVESIQAALANHSFQVSRIHAPATLDGGDICLAEMHFFVGISNRTNIEGAKQFRDIVGRLGYTVDFIDVIGIHGILHLKSGMSYIGDNTVVLIEAMKDLPELFDYQKIVVDPDENYAANCIRVNDSVIVAEGYPRLGEKIEANGLPVIPLEVSELQKMDGGLSCLSLRF